MIAMKFGGSSVGAPERMAEVARIVRLFRKKKPVVVISALAGVTDLLIQTAQDFLHRRKAKGEAHFRTLSERHLSFLKHIVRPSQDRKATERKITVLLHQLREVLDGVYLLRELSPKSLALVSSFGERLSVPLLAAILRDIGVKAQDFDATELVATDDNFLTASVDMEITSRNFQKKVLPICDDGVVPIITGFIGADRRGLVTTLGRGGSDYTGSIVGACLDCDEIWIWTDVSGVFSADPRIVPEAKALRHISYQEAAEMSYFGAKVIHPKTMLPAVSKKIPIRIKNTFAPADSGTLITERRRDIRPVRMVTAMKKLHLVSVAGQGMVGISGITARIFLVADRVASHIYMFSQASSGHNMCLVASVEDSIRLKQELDHEFEKELSCRELETIGLHKNVAIVSVIGGGMNGTPGVSGTLFSSLGKHGINVCAIAQGSSELNISFAVDEHDADATVKILHEAFDLVKNL